MDLKELKKQYNLLIFKGDKQMKRFINFVNNDMIVRNLDYVIFITKGLVNIYNIFDQNIYLIKPPFLGDMLNRLHSQRAHRRA